MRRVVARFSVEAGASAAAETLRERGLEPDRSAIENPFFDPTAPISEARGLAWGAILGALVGLLLFQAVNADVLWVPRWSPMMSADEFAVPFLGLGLGAAVGGFVGGVVGTMRPVPASTAAALAVSVPDDRAGGRRPAPRRGRDDGPRASHLPREPAAARVAGAPVVAIDSTAASPAPRRLPNH